MPARRTPGDLPPTPLQQAWIDRNAARAALVDAEALAAELMAQLDRANAAAVRMATRPEPTTAARRAPKCIGWESA